MSCAPELLLPHLLTCCLLEELASPAWSHEGIHLLEEVLRDDNMRTCTFLTRRVPCCVRRHGTIIAPKRVSSIFGWPHWVIYSPQKRQIGTHLLCTCALM